MFDVRDPVERLVGLNEIAEPDDDEELEEEPDDEEELPLDDDPEELEEPVVFVRANTRTALDLE